MKKVIAYVHSHWDREWYREFEEFRLRLIEVFDEVITALKKGDLPVFYFDGQTSALEDYLENKVFAEYKASVIEPDKADVDGFNEYIKRYESAVAIEKEAINTLK
mgnify:CR=1 FL=1